MYTVSIFARVMSLEDMDVSESRLKIRNSVLLFSHMIFNTEKCTIILPHVEFNIILIYKLQVWTQKCAVLKASVDVNISYY
jgi:hypothetical protein